MKTTERSFELDWEFGGTSWSEDVYVRNSTGGKRNDEEEDQDDADFDDDFEEDFDDDFPEEEDKRA